MPAKKQIQESSVETKRPRRTARIKGAVSRHYYSYMPNKKGHRILVWVAFLVCSGLIAAQMMYPLDRALPFARLDSRAVGWKSEIELAEKVSRAFMDAHLQFRVGDHTTRPVHLGSVGAEPQVDSMVAELRDYPFWQRLIPGTLLLRWPHIDSWRVTYSSKPTNEYSEKISRELSRLPQNAGLAIEDGVLVAAPEVSGVEVTPQQVQRALFTQTYPYRGGIVVDVGFRVVRPTRTQGDLESVRIQAEQALARPVSLLIQSETIIPDETEKASWLQLTEVEDGTTALALDPAAVRTYLDNLSKKYGRPAGQTRVTVKNGYETARVTGENGLRVDSDALIPEIQGYMIDGRGRLPLQVRLVETAPAVIYNDTYTATREGLQAYVSEKARHGAWLSIQQIDGEKWEVGADAEESVVSGSTYKLFVALALFDRMNKGEIGWNDPMLDTTVSRCFDRMTIASTNPCAEQWLRQFGRANVNEFLYERGFSRATTFTHPEATHTSAADLTRFMVGLENGSLIGGAQRDRLLHSLATHSYRYGIPTGSKGRVYDKVGFLWDYINDTAIVYHPQGTYVMTILTKGKSYGAIATMTREIEQIMYP